MAVQYGEYQELTFRNVTGGTFQLQIGTQLTPTITISSTASGVIRQAETSDNIRAGLEAIFGVGNVRMQDVFAPPGAIVFSYNFINSLDRSDMPDVQVVNAAISGTNATITQLHRSIRSSLRSFSQR